MKRQLLTIFFTLCLCLTALAQAGIPFIRNFAATEYGAHNRNFDVVCSDDGVVFFANFEGLLYYDQVEWRIIHTPGITRITSLCRDAKGVIWAGGYNYLGRLVAKADGNLELQEACKPGSVRGDVIRLWEADGEIRIQMSDGRTLALGSDGSVGERAAVQPPHTGVSDESVRQTIDIGYGSQAWATTDRGVIVTDALGRPLYTITEDNGLCSSSVNRIAYNGHGLLWGATDSGLFAIAVPTAYGRFSASEGLRGEVLSFGELQDVFFAGTQNGLFWKNGTRFVPVTAVNHACWKLYLTDNGLLAATSGGVYRIGADKTARQLTTNPTMSLLAQTDGYYSGELDGVYYNALSPSGGVGAGRTKVSSVENVIKMVGDTDGSVWLQSIYGQVWSRSKGDTAFAQVIPGEGNKEEAATIPTTLVETPKGMVVLNAHSTKPFGYPLFSYYDSQGIVWLTNIEGRRLYAMRDSVLTEFAPRLHPLGDYGVRAMYHDEGLLWIGGDFGAVVLSTAATDPALSVKPHLLVRSAVLGGDSILWGGFGKRPEQLPLLGSDDHDLRFTFSLDYAPLVGHTLYRYQLDDGAWSAWSTKGIAAFTSLPSGSYELRLQALTADGRLVEAAPLNFQISYPFYLRWYMLLLYLLLFGVLVYALLRWRLYRLEKEKIRLENIVQERTSEVVRQKNEIEEKSNSLEKALKDLGEAQNELIRQEKMATVGKLTQGLIDRILNPLNYINNFSKLSEGLVSDLVANIEDDKDAMDPENYEDTVDVLGMLRGNLQKVSEHGQNTTRTLKAMEEMLKDRTGGIVSMDLAAVLRQDFDMLRNYHASDIAQYHIATSFSGADEPIAIMGNADHLSKTVMSLLANAVYAVVKKAQRMQYQPEVALAARQEGGKVMITVRDNGIGIESGIIGKIFDPFFTTKTTGEAAGVGLYLSREIAQNHGGDIRVESEKDVFTQFTITLPMA